MTVPFDEAMEWATAVALTSGWVEDVDEDAYLDTEI